MNILLVEDDNESVKACQEFAALDDRGINIEVANTIETAKMYLNKNIDTAIVDIKLGNKSDAGNSVIDEINALSLRIPTVIHTGTPSNVTASALKVFTRGENTYEEIFDYLFDVYNTGITELLGRKGIFEQVINNFYSTTFIKSKDSWIRKCSEYTPELVKKSLIRTLIYYIDDSLNDDSGKTFYEEFYLTCLDDDIHTGSIAKENETGKCYIVVSPACDLVKREEGIRNVDIITLCEIDTIEEHGYTFKEANDKNLGKDKIKSVTSLLSNSKNRYHWLPEVSEYKGGLIDFTKTASIKESDFFNRYNLLSIRVSPPYIKNILSRFSSYYARQGQPDLNVDEYVNKLKLVSDGDIR